MIDSQENIESKAETTHDVIDSEKQPTPTNDMYVPPISHKVSTPSWTIASVTKMEAFVMFLVLLLILSIGMVYMYSSIDDANTKDSEQITNLLNHIAMLSCGAHPRAFRCLSERSFENSGIPTKHRFI